MKVSWKYYTIEDDFFIFPLGDLPYFVLGVQWLVSWETTPSTTQLCNSSSRVEAVKSHFKASRRKRTKMLPLRDWRQSHRVQKKIPPQAWDHKRIEEDHWNKDGL